MNSVIKEVAKVTGLGALHWIMRTLSVLAVIGIGWAIYAGIIRPVIKPKPTENYSQKAEQIQNYEYRYDYSDKDIAFFGLKLWKIRLGITIK